MKSNKGNFLILFFFLLLTNSAELLSKEKLSYLSCKCTKAINSLITEGGCWDENILITVDKPNKKMEWGSLEYPNLRLWMDIKISDNEFKGKIRRTHYRLNRITLVADQRYECTGKNPNCKGSHEFYMCKIITKKI